VIGESYNLPTAAVALRPVGPAAPTPLYAAPAVGGMGYLAAGFPGVSAGLDGVAWPSERAVSSVAFVSHGPGTVLPPARMCRWVNGCGLRSSYCSARRRLQEVETMLNDTWYSRDLPVLTSIAEKLEGGSTPVDTEQLINELGLTRQDLMAALRALDVEYLIVRWPERITFRRSDPSTVVEGITSRAREAVGMWPSTEARQTAARRPGPDQE
jgi:hypothetical protein